MKSLLSSTIVLSAKSNCSSTRMNSDSQEKSENFVPVGLLSMMQVLGQNPNGAHHRLADVKVSGPLNDAVNYEVKLPAEQHVQRLVLAGLGDAVPGQDQPSVGTLKH